MFLAVLFSCEEGQTSYIKKQKFNLNWRFLKLDDTIPEAGFHDKDFNDSLWEQVILPHTPQLEPKVVNDQWQGTCWYRNRFELPHIMKGKQLWLKFEGAMNIAEVWVNGNKLIEHHGGYLPFVVDFTNVAKWSEENIVAVRLNNEDNPITGPKPLKILDFNTYGGIYRNVWLIAKDPLHISDPILENKRASGGIFVTYPEVSKEQARIQVKSHVKNLNKEKTSFIIRNTLIKGDSIISLDISEENTLAPNSDEEILANILVVKPELWSPSTPNLYHLKTEVISNGRLVDQEITRIGIKTMKFIGQDFYLNGEKTFLRGVNRHQEYPYIGYALSDRANYRDAKKIKDAGFDYVRLSHYPQSPSFMDACDELGIININAILGWQYFSEDEAFQKHVFQTAKDLIRRDRNHASVLAWEVSLNESWMPEPFIDSLTAIAHNEYPGNQCFTAGWQPYGYDIYLQARQHRINHYEPKLKKPYNVSEYGDWEYYAMNAGLNQDSWTGLLHEDRSSRQLRSANEVRLLQQATNIQEAHNDNLGTPAFADGYWVMYDYNRGYANDLEASGIMDIFRLPKPSYYFYKSQRNAYDSFGKPIVYIANYWTEESPLEVRVFSNCDEVELFVNGKSKGRRKPDKNRISDNLEHPPFTFHLSEFQSGSIEAKAFIKDKLVTSHRRQTPKEASHVLVEMDLSGYPLESGTNDVIFAYAKVVDSNGTWIPSFNGSILFDIQGDAELIGENPVTCEAGIASILVRAGENVNNIEVSATFQKENLIVQN